MRALREEENFEIPMTSLIDVVFLLIIFFLVATNFIKKELDQEIRLPESEAGSKAGLKPEKLVINVRENGIIIVDGSVVTETELRNIVSDFVKNNPDKRAVVRGDSRVSYQSVMKVFGICKAQGIKQVDLPVIEPGND